MRGNALAIALGVLTALFAVSTGAYAQAPVNVGMDACATCHEDLARSFKKTPHWSLETGKNRTSGQSCELCHGSGGEHAETLEAAKIVSFRTLTPSRTQETCLDCHAKEGGHGNRLFDQHARKSVACTSCHSVHGAYAGTALLAKPVNELCGTCHAPESAGFKRPFSHLLSTGMMSCADCHAPHGSPVKAQVRVSHENQTTCLNCHSDKRGPFAFEHMPVKTAGCTSCHDPHGSFNPRMLARSEVRQVCLECHANSPAFGSTPPAFHDLRSERIRNCTLCHTKIHGSHMSRSLVR